MFEVTLSFSKYDGRTYAARILGRDSKYGLAREFVAPVARSASRSGATGMRTYLLEPGVYELSERGRRSYVRVEPDGSLTDLADAAAAVAAVEEAR